MVHPRRLLPTHRLSFVLAFATILSTTIFKQADRASHVVHGWIPRGGHNMNIHGHPRRMVQSSTMFMKKRGKKKGRKNSKSDRDQRDGEDITSDILLSSDYEVTNGVVSRLEAMYGMDTFRIKGQDWILDSAKLPGQTKNGQRASIILEDWIGMADGLCLDDCCGDECDEQCDIPEDYKRFTRTDAPKVDVMSFLGIRRPEPLRVQRDWD
ncbi:hypothetical protein HJC23_008358 [Cyclotella cryptica]|uniref:Uncharacterized protein n=1 Tax=Cyclotella cryptica TaxID=29204 RepID=A0ABD3Q4X6_9STRA|eukprot:CCRYP_008637-RA/>CCRYP_008637-RA protein AED:0.27 eAED:0.27 QI:213/1/1/1/1/1/2/271/209